MNPGKRLCANCLLLLFAANSFAVDVPSTALLPILPGAPETRSTPFIAWFEDLSKSGYLETEFLVSGDANIYEYANSASQSSKVRVRDPDVAYASRILVRRPVNPDAFNGTVYLEVLNPTAGWDGDPIWQNTHDYMIRAGAAYVGLTSKPVALNFLRDTWGTGPGLVTRDNVSGEDGLRALQAAIMINQSLESHREFVRSTGYFEPGASPAVSGAPGESDG